MPESKKKSRKLVQIVATSLAIAVAVVSEILVGWIQPFADNVSDFFRDGDPVLTSVVSIDAEVPGEDLLLVGGVTNADLDRLETLRGEQREQWFRERDAITAGPKEVKIQVKGNRRDQVRIVGIHPSPECSYPADSAYLINMDGRGGIPPSIGVVLSLDEPFDEPVTQDPEHPLKYVPFFRDRTITLEDKETEYLVITILPSYGGGLCQTAINLEVLVNGKTTTQTIGDDDNPIYVLSTQSTRDPSPFQMYEGMCWRPVPYTPSDMAVYGRCADPSNVKENW
ncbi:hypothetical protein AB0K08_04930 [Citricoccus sp. NPDC055426]|uniref:hypothetical protein n=1 Tax=Citricoccus sp. NPDC055426 TaxID=3155536 RepID=UPI00343F0A3D